MSNPAKKHYTLTIKDFYLEYKKRKGDEALDYKTYRSILEDMFCEIQRAIIYDRLMWQMPYGLGSTYIMAKKNANLKKSKKAIDFNLTKKLGKVVRHLNQHTFGVYFGFKWNKTYSRFRNKAYYTFTATTSRPATKLGIGKKGLSNHIKELSKDPNKRSYIRI